jgi:hypothetical protein
VPSIAVFAEHIGDFGKESPPDALVEGETGDAFKFLFTVAVNQAQRALLNTRHSMVRFAATFEVALLKHGGNHFRKTQQPVSPRFDGEEEDDSAGQQRVVDVDEDQSGWGLRPRTLRLVTGHCVQHKVGDMSVTVTLIGKPGCHLCDDAKAIVDRVAEANPDVNAEEVSLDDNPLWAELYGELIPVILVDGVELAHWRVDEQALEKAVDERLTADID